ncbi:MAG: DNA-3-methyladenine glycosylase [Gemmatimonadetes bacterium]|nr:DNA-3-methyladenine glycosylase [Gemmatimonadota bacterium]
MGRPLAARFYRRDTERVARDLLGCVVETRVRGVRTAGRIVEVEAYVGPHDPAAHGYGWRKTARNARLFGPPGTCYVYFIYGNHWCANVVTERDGYPSAVLLRALEPLDGLVAMRRRRGTGSPTLWCAGPGRLCEALGITGGFDGESLAGPRIRVYRPTRQPPMRIAASPRVGISRAADWPLRFYVTDSPWLSRRERRERQERETGERGPPTARQ